MVVIIGDGVGSVKLATCLRKKVACPHNIHERHSRGQITNYNMFTCISSETRLIRGSYNSQIL